MIVPEHLWTDVKDPATWRNEEPVGTGPFVLGNYNDQQYSMDRNPDYWQADRIEIEHIILPATNTQLDTVTRGYDWAYSFISDVEGTWGAASPDNTWWFPPGGVISLVPNLEVAPFDDVNVRRGIALALDREEIAETASEGYMQPAGQTGLILPNQEQYLDPEIPDQGMLAQDRDAALAAFAESGYTLQGDQLVGPDGEQLAFSLTTANGFSDWTRAAQTVQRQLADIGVKVSLKLPQPAGYQSAIGTGDFEMAIGGMGNGDVYQAYNSLLSSDFYVPTGEVTTNNFERYRSPEADALLEEFRATIDPDRQTEIVHELQSIVYEEVPVIGMYYGGIWGLFNDAKFTGWPSADDPYMIPQNYDSAPLGIFTHLKRTDGETSEVRPPEDRPVRAHPVGRDHPELLPAPPDARLSRRRRDREALPERSGLRRHARRDRGPARGADRFDVGPVRGLPRPGRPARLRRLVHVLPADRVEHGLHRAALHARPRRHRHDPRVRDRHADRRDGRLAARHVAGLAADADRVVPQHVPVLLDGAAAAVLPRLRAALVPDHRRLLGDDHPGFTWDFIVDLVRHAFLPALTILLTSLGGWIIGMRNAMINTLGEDYITFGEANGLRGRTIALRYAARNAILPNLTGFGLTLGGVVGGSILVEQVFGYPGIGYLLFNAVIGQDYPLMQALFLMITVSVLIANFLVDILYGVLDPRTRR